MSQQNKLMGVGQSAASAAQIVGDVASGLTAAGTGQTTALALSCACNYVETVASGTGVRLYGMTGRPSSIGDEQSVYNAGASTLSVYPPSGEQIVGAAQDAAFSVPAGVAVTFKKVKNTLWLVVSGDAAFERFVQSGTGAVSRTVSQELGETITPFQFGGIGNGVANDSAAILAASVAAVAQGKDVDFGGHTWLLGTSIALTGSHPNLGWRLRGATLKKGFNGDLVTVSQCPNFAIHGSGTIDGQHGTYTGRGIVFSGTGSSSPYFGAGITFTSFTDSHIEFGADSGLYARILCHFQFGSGQSDFRAIYVNGPDTSAIFRFIAHSIANLGYHQLAGANNTFFAGCAFKRVQMDSACAVTEIGDCSWGNSGTAVTIIGQNTMINDCRIAASITLDSTLSGSFVGNRQTSGTFTNNSTALVLHYNNTTGQLHINGQIAYGYPSAQERLLSSRIANVPDSDLTAQVGSSAPTTIFNTVTGVRAVTLSTTNAIAGDRFRFINKGASNVTVGGLKTLAGGANNWCDVEFDGASWVQTGFGAL